MASYNPTTNFTAKDALAAGDPSKIIRGADFGVEFDAISTAINSIPDTPFVNVKDYGATGDGITDDTAAIQSAINYASANSIQTVLIPDGHYKYTTLRMYHDATDNPNFQESPNRDGRIRLVGHGRFSSNDLKFFDVTTRGYYGTLLEGIAGGEGIIVDPTDAFDDKDARNFYMEHMTVTANNTGYVITNRACPEFTLFNCAIKQVNDLGSGILNRNAWFTTIENSSIWGPSNDSNSPVEPDNNLGSAIVGETDFFAGEWNIHNSHIDSWKHGVRWNFGQFVNVSIRDTAIQNCNGYNFYGEAGTIFNLKLDNVYFENQTTQGISFIKSVDDCIRALEMSNCFMLAGNNGVARVTSHCIDLDNPDCVNIESMYVFRPRQTFLNVTATRNLQNVSGELKNSMFLTDEDLSLEPTVYLLDGILPNVHNCVWPTMSQGVHNTTGDVRLYDESVYGKYLRSFTDVTGTTANSKFSYGDTEQVTVATSPYRMTGAGIEQKCYYDLTHAISTGLAVYLPAPTSVKTDGRVVIVRNNENSTSASNYPFINVFVSTGVPPSTGFLSQLAPGEAAMFVFDGKGTNGGDFKCVGKWADTGSDYTINADTGSESFQSGYESLRFTGGTNITTAVTSPSFGEDEVTISLDTSSGLNFGDNDKAIFGAGSDLQIYHDGSNSYVQDSGAGQFYIQGSAAVHITDPTGNSMARFVDGGTTELYHNGSKKIETTSTGIDVTGSVTADGATIDGAVTVNGAGVNLDDAYSLTWGDGSAQVRGSGSSEALDLRTASTTRLNIDADGDVSLYNSAGTSQDLFWDASTSRLGLGTITPTADLDVNGVFTVDVANEDAIITGATPALEFIENDNGGSKMRMAWNSSGAFAPTLYQSLYGDSVSTYGGINIQTRASDASGNQVVYAYDPANDRNWWGTRAAGDVAMQLTSDGTFNVRGGDVVFEDSLQVDKFFWDASESRLGLGTVTPSHELHMFSSSPQIRMEDSEGVNTYGDLQYNGVSLNLISRGGASAYGAITFARTDGTSNINTAQINASGDFRFYDNTGTEGMRWDASESRLGIGNSTPTEDLHIGDGTAAVALTLQGTQLGTNAINMGDSVNRFAGRILYDNSVNDFTFTCAGSEKVRFASSGNVGIGTNVPGYLVDAQSPGDAAIRIKSTGTGASDDSLLRLQIAGTTASNLIAFGDSGNTFAGSIRYVHQSDYMRFDTNATERMRIDNSGNLLVGTTGLTPHTATVNTDAGTVINPSGMLRLGRNANPSLHVNRITDDGLLALWYRNGVNVGNISVTSTTTTYNTSSDQRLKDNIVDAPSASDDIDAIQIRSFDWKADGSHQKYGMIAQELNTVAPEAVTAGDTEEDMMSVDYSKLVPMLIKEIQELRARVASLESV